MKFTKKAFAEWLDSKRDRAIAGNPQDRLRCPLCSFLKSQGAKVVNMSFETRVVDGRVYSNPKWAEAFQKLICNHVGEDLDKRITVKTAAAYLRRS